MFPVSDDKPATRFPIVVIFIAVINAYVFWREIHLAPDRLEAMIGTFALIPSRDFAPGLRYMSFFTSMFLHGGLVHLLVNLWSFWIFGDNIEGELGHRIDYFAYPSGGFNESIQALVKESGYKGACTTNRGYHPHNDDPYEIKRIRFGNNDHSDLVLWVKLSGYYHLFRKWKNPE